MRQQPFLAGEALAPESQSQPSGMLELADVNRALQVPLPACPSLGSPGHEDEHAVGADGVDDAVGHAALVALGALVSEVHALEELCGLLLSTLGCL